VGVVDEALTLVNRALKRAGMSQLDDSNRDVKDFRDIRNRVIMHGREVYLSTPRYLEWARREYPNARTVLGLVGRVARLICSRIGRLVDKGYIKEPKALVIDGPPELKDRDVRKFAEVLKAQGCF
jgi:hypothetical protein